MGHRNGWTDGRTFDRVMTLAAHYADRVTRQEFIKTCQPTDRWIRTRTVVNRQFVH